jgi:hypothetical protein
MYNYFPPLSEAKIKEPVVRGRFVFLDRKGETDTPQATPVGISYYTQIPTSDCGYAQYHTMACPNPVQLELAEAVNIGIHLTYDSLGRGVYACLNPAYAIARQGGVAGDYISVLPKILAASLSEFNDDFAPCEFI